MIIPLGGCGGRRVTPGRIGPVHGRMTAPASSPKTRRAHHGPLLEQPLLPAPAFLVLIITGEEFLTH